ncbi:tetratricopeptide repeat protein [Microbacter margulisiae]|uniref:Tetratricopeptide (TPR) repeat protein n=1 Tax=Microbacter margulisiae TaxID=1350067 RepID=A0A7W5DTK0_9PORP|nr:tetratricopeptide repeat protein [Microbacter margulisiae]MBB3187993.1 tetratricopeptide (TPR) repeat protein [Microbacter margulisiae]
MKKLISLLAVLLLLNITAHGQESYAFTQPAHAFRDGVALYLQKQYSAAQQQFRAFLHQANTLDKVNKEEADYYIASCAFALRQSDAMNLIATQIDKYSNSPQISQLHYMAGILNFEAKHYIKATNQLAQVSAKDLDPSEQQLCYFATGYSYMAISKFSDALTAFQPLLGSEKYDAVATYYCGYCKYALDQYSAALPYFQKIDQDQAFASLAPYYVIQIYAKLHDYDKVKSYGNNILATQPHNPKNNEVYRLLGECNYRERNYTQAIAQFEKAGSGNELPRSSLYMWGLSYYLSNKFIDAVMPLSKVAAVSDSLGQNSFFWLGNSYMHLKEPLKAKLAYESASKMSFDKKVQEEAMYNYAMTIYTNASPFGESIKVFDQFLSRFPNSTHGETIKKDLATALLASRDYPAALQAIQKLQTNSPEIAAAKENILFHLGIEQFNLHHYQPAIDYFNQSIASETFASPMAQIYFWRGESYYRQKEYQSAIQNWTAYQSSPQSASDANYNESNYNLGYAYFHLNDFKRSQLYFLRFAGSAHDPLSATYNDALLRIADCHFQLRNFLDARLFYTQVISKNVPASAYALYQTAFIDGLQRHYSIKIDELNKLVTNYPTSEYTEQAYYEIGRSYISLNQYNKAIAAYQTLLTKFPNGALARKAALEIGMAYYNNNEKQQAIAAYKTVVANYPGSTEANEAMQNLENVYVELANVNDYLAYRRSLGKNNELSFNAQDSLTFVTAEKLYISGQPEQAASQLRQYLAQFCPQGNYCIKATYYLADSYRQLHQMDSALVDYQKLATINGNPYQEEALTQCASITYDQKQYNAALNYFQSLLHLTSNSTYKQAALLGVLRSSYLTKNDTTTIAAAKTILNDNQATPDMKAEARFDRAAAYQLINQPDSSFADWNLLAQDLHTLYGAEAKYDIAKYYFETNDLAKSENEILDFINKGTPYRFWLAKSFLLLSDIYVKRGDYFQANQYLLSLRDNYHANDEIQTLIQQRLQAIKEHQNQQSGQQ